MRKAIILLVLLIFLTSTVYAEELLTRQAEAYGTDKLEGNIPTEVERILDDTEDGNIATFFSTLQKILVNAIENGETVLRASVRSIIRILCIAILCRVMSCVEAPHIDLIVSAAGTMAVTLCCVTDLRNMIGLGISSMDELITFTGTLMPVMAAAAIGSGAVNGAAAIQSVAVFFIHLLIRVCNGVLLPLVYAGLALSVVDSVTNSSRLKGFRELINWLIKTGLKYVTYAFTGIISLSGMVAGTADAAALKAAKAAISTAVPVVGSMISGVADTVLSNAAWLKNSVGIYGVLALLGIFMFPFIKMGISYVSFRLTTALCGVLETKLGVLLEAISQSMGYIMAMVGSGLLMSIISCFCLMRTAQP